jgi:hypothetical protein
VHHSTRAISGADSAHHLTGLALPKNWGDPVKERQSGRDRVGARKRSRELAAHVTRALETHLSTERHACSTR